MEDNTLKRYPHTKTLKNKNRPKHVWIFDLLHYELLENTSGIVLRLRYLFKMTNEIKSLQVAFIKLVLRNVKYLNVKAKLQKL